MTTGTDHSHTTRAMQHVALAEFLRVPTSEIQSLDGFPNLFRREGVDYAVTDRDTVMLADHEYRGRSLGFNIWRLE